MFGLLPVRLGEGSLYCGRMYEGVSVQGASRRGRLGFIIADDLGRITRVSDGWIGKRSVHVPFVRLIYWVKIGEESLLMDYRVELVTTALLWGGVR